MYMISLIAWFLSSTVILHSLRFATSVDHCVFSQFPAPGLPQTGSNYLMSWIRWVGERQKKCRDWEITAQTIISDLLFLLLLVLFQVMSSLLIYYGSLCPASVMHGAPNAPGDRRCQRGNLMPRFREQTVVPKRATPCSVHVRETTTKREEKNKREGFAGWIVSWLCVWWRLRVGEKELINSLHDEQLRRGGWKGESNRARHKRYGNNHKSDIFLYTKALSCLINRSSRVKTKEQEAPKTISRVQDTETSHSTGLKIIHEHLWGEEAGRSVYAKYEEPNSE